MFILKVANFKTGIEDEAEAFDALEAIAAGYKAAGFQAEVTLEERKDSYDDDGTTYLGKVTFPKAKYDWETDKKEDIPKPIKHKE